MFTCTGSIHSSSSVLDFAKVAVISSFQNVYIRICFLILYMRKKKKLESSFDGRILPNILDFNVNLDAQLISKSNYIFGASTLILIFILNRFLSIESPEFSMENLPLIILLTGSFITSLSSISIILPKIRIFSKKERIKENKVAKY